MTTHPLLEADLASRELRNHHVRNHQIITRHIISSVLLIFLCVLFSGIRWLKTEAFWGDPPRWIFEAWRVALSELPYRDFTWQYPPLSVLTVGVALRVFGATFVVLQIVVDIISMALVWQFWRVARLLLRPGLALAVAAALTCGGAGNTGNFALFSLRIYTPALLLGMLGFLIFLEPAIIRISSGLFQWRSAMLFSVGATVALLSKPEFAMGVVGVLFAMAIYEARLCLGSTGSLALWFRREAWLLGLTLSPALTIYALLAWRVGLSNLITGLGGYGMARLVCPWWPTGLALFGAVVALCQGAAVLVLYQRFRPGNSYCLSRHACIALRAAAALAIPATVLYFPYCIKELPVFAQGSSPSRMVSFFLSLGSVLLPVMWWSITLWPAWALRVASGRQLSRELGVFLLLSTSGLLMSTRSLFGGTLNQLTLVAVAAYPVWFILGPLLLERFLHGSDMAALRHSSRPVLVLVASYAFLRFGAAVVTELRVHYQMVDTFAGRVQVSDDHAASSAAVYRYIVDHTSSSDRVLDVAYGGLVNFASRHTSPLYSTQFSALAPAQKYLDMDLDRIRVHPPQLVIARDQPDTNAEYGLCTETGCMFPALVWRPTRLACDPGQKFPVLEFIKRNYRQVARLGDMTIYAPQAPGPPGVAGQHL
jgi:hypothetical protein